jgi:hypothetical protein
VTTSGESQKVVQLAQRQGDLQADAQRPGELLRRVRSIAQNRINGLVSALFENVDDALFDLAEKAESNAAQTQFFDGMREVRKKRPLVERLFQERIGRNFAEFATGELKPIESAQAAPDGNTLSLVDDQELEESLAISSMVAKAESRLVRPLYQINQRLAAITGGKSEERASPVGPAMLCEAFRGAVREFDLNVQVKLIIYKLFDRYVMAGLNALYDEINIELIRAGVLPQIRHEVPRGTRHPPAAPTGIPARGQAADIDGGHAEAVAGHGASALHAEVYETLRSLLAGRRGHSGSHAGSFAAADGEPADAGLDAATLLNALSVLQGQAVADDRFVMSADTTREIKQELLAQVRRFGNDAQARHVSSADEDTIDLVGMLFEFILRDRNLPAAIQALLGRLQIPYLKVAIVDRHLFAQKTHPARRLLDALAEAGIGWSPESDRDNRLHDRIRQSVDTILQKFDDDLRVFDEELGEFNRFMEEHRRRAEHAEQRVAEATRGREKLNEARRVTAREVLHRIGNRKLPSVAHTILSRPWANFMVLTLLRKGEDSEEWKKALRFADEFIWSTTPKRSEAGRNRLRLLIPQIEAALRHGLATVAYHESDITAQIDELGRFYARLLEGEAPELKTAREVIAASNAPYGMDEAAVADSPAAPIVPEERGATASGEASAEPQAAARPAANPTMPQSPVEEIILSSVEPEPTAEDSEPTAADDDEFLVAARGMKPGTWFEMVGEDGQRERAKLSWISPISGKFLFVNRRGLKVCDKTVYALAAELRRGSTTALLDVPLFDRALDAIVARLRAASPAGDSVPAEKGPSTE